MEGPRRLSPAERAIVAEEAARLLRYLNEGGPVSYTRINRPNGLKRISWEVEAERFDVLE